MNPGQSHWSGYHRSWARLRPPLRPNSEVVAAVRALLAGGAGPTLMLGVTPEFADLAPDLVAVDRSPGMIGGVWPGDTAARRAIVGDWLKLDFPAGHFGAAIGDSPLNALEYPKGHAGLYDQLARVLRPGARVVFRAFCLPEPCESVASVRAAAHAAQIPNFHAFKWRLVMAMVAAAGNPNLPVARVHEIFGREFPDRDALAATTGWPRDDIDTIDVYKDSTEFYSFPTARAFRAAAPAAFTDIRFIPAGTYELAERCPLLVMERA